MHVVICGSGHPLPTQCGQTGLREWKLARPLSRSALGTPAASQGRLQSPLEVTEPSHSWCWVETTSANPGRGPGRTGSEVRSYDSRSAFGPWKGKAGPLLSQREERLSLRAGLIFGKTGSGLSPMNKVRGNCLGVSVNTF